MTGSKRLTLSLPLFGILTMLAASTVAAQPRPSAPVIRDNSTPSAPAPTPPSSRGENFSANKTPAQLFQSDCTGAGCHKGAGGLAKNSSSLGLTSFLREHYTNSRESASALAAYLMGAAGSAPAERPGRGEPATPRPPRAAARTPAGEEAKPEEGQGPLRPAQPRRQPAAPGAAGAPAGETPTPPGDIVRPEPGAKPAPAAAQQRNQPQRGRQHQTTAAPTPPPEAAPAPPPPPPPPPPVVHDIFD